MAKRSSKPTVPIIRIPGCNLHPGELPSAFLTQSPTVSPHGYPGMPILRKEVAVPGQQIAKTKDCQTDLLERIRSLEDTIHNLRSQNKFLEEEKRDLQKDVNHYIEKYGHRRRRRARKRKDFKIKVEQKEEEDSKHDEEQKKGVQEVVDSIPKRRRFHPPESTLEYSYTLDYIFQKSEAPSSLSIPLSSSH